MDATRFDAFVHAIAVTASRRTALGGALAAGLAALLTWTEAEDAAARKKQRKKKKCKGGKKKCGKTCIPKSNCCGDASCGGCETCQNGSCASGCQPGQTCQDDQCICTVETCAGGCCDGTTCLADSKECEGACIPRDDCCLDGDCPDDATCEDGVCVCSVADETICGESCVNLATDGANCGACGNVCPSGGCVHGVCTCESGIDCPGSCTCSDRLDGGGICFKGGNNGQPCDSDDDCPLRSACFSINLCSIPCLE